MFCKNCGTEVADEAIMCPKCGQGFKNVSRISDKSKIVAGLLAFFLGALGIHNFYLGYTGKGIVQLFLTIIGWIFLFGPLIAGIWAFIEMILIFIGQIKDVDGNKLA